jgi:hypothetical protein
LGSGLWGLVEAGFLLLVKFVCKECKLVFW